MEKERGRQRDLGNNFNQAGFGFDLNLYPDTGSARDDISPGLARNINKLVSIFFANSTIM
jgi:hypothetical protein